MRPPDSVGLAATLGGIAAFGAAVGVYLIRKIRAREATRPAGPPPARPTPAWVWLFLIVTVATITYSATAKTPKGRRGRAVPAPTLALSLVVGVGIVAGGLVVLLVGHLGVQFYQLYDRDVSRAWKEANAGDVEGAIAGLRAAMEGRGPSEVRSNALGALLSLREDWPGAYKAFVEAEQVGGRKPLYVGNQGVSLWKLGRPEEAAILLEEALARAPKDVGHPTNLGLVLIDLGRIDEARERLALAEANLREFKVIPPSAKEPYRVQVESLRKKLAGDPGARDRAAFDEA